jgi:signal transduction histidine kinase
MPVRRTLTANALAGRLAPVLERRHVPLLAIRVPELERVAWREGRTAARRLERRAREAFARIAVEGLRAGDLSAHDRNTEVFSIALTAPTRGGDDVALPDDCRAALARATSALSRLLSVPLESGWTLVTRAAGGEGLGADLRAALERGARERQRYDFFSTVAHEMRAPLTAIRGYLETLLDEPLEERRRRRFVEIARGETLRLGRLIDGMFTISLLDADHAWEAQTQRGEATALRAATAAALAALGPRIIQRRARVAPPRLPHVGVAIACDHLVQVLVNVVGNALDHGREGVRVAIGGSKRGDAVRLWVDDDGPGVPASEREAIFTFGYRARSAGSGLGLGVVRRLLERTGGDVYATDSELGGTRIVIGLRALDHALR